MVSFRKRSSITEIEQALHRLETSDVPDVIRQGASQVEPSSMFGDSLEARLREQARLASRTVSRKKIVTRTSPNGAWATESTIRSVAGKSLIGIGLTVALMGVFWLSLFYNPNSPDGTSQGSGNSASATDVPFATPTAVLGNVLNPPGIAVPNMAGWYTFTAPLDYFSVLMPRQLVDMGGRDGWNSYGVKDGAITYMVEDTYSTVLNPSNPDKWFEAALPSLADQMSGRVVGQKPLMLSGMYPGRELEVQRTDGRFTRSRIFLVSKRLYNVFAIAADMNAAYTPDVNKFLDSFALSPVGVSSSPTALP
jgi:hypothetical protein